jgi:hypothetical protein
MFKSYATGTAALALGLVFGGAAFAQTTSPAPGAAKGTKMTSAECTSLWNRLDTGKTGNVSQTQAQQYVSDFKSVDTNNDGKLSQAEFQAGCSKGLINSTASTGAGSGTGTMAPKSK